MNKQNFKYKTDWVLISQSRKIDTKISSVLSPSSISATHYAIYTYFDKNKCKSLEITINGKSNLGFDFSRTLLRWISVLFRNREINLHINGIQSQDSAQNFVKWKTLLNRDFHKVRFDCIMVSQIFKMS